MTIPSGKSIINLFFYYNKFSASNDIIKLLLTFFLLVLLVGKSFLSNRYFTSLSNSQVKSISKESIIEHIQNNAEIMNEIKKIIPNDLELIPETALYKEEVSGNKFDSHKILQTSARIFVGIERNTSKIAWHLFYSKLLKHRSIGYAGYIDFLVGINNDGKITGIKILYHNETQSFIEGMYESWFLDQFIGKDIIQKFVPNVNFDSITHATVSINAFANELNEICKEAQSILNNVKHTNDIYNISKYSYTHKPFAFYNISLNTFVTLISIIFFLLCKIFKFPVFLYNLAILLLFGVITKQFLSLTTIVLLFQNPLMFTKSSIFFFTFVSIIFIIFFKKGYCLHICPTGKLQEIISSILHKFTKYKFFSDNFKSKINTYPSNDSNESKNIITDANYISKNSSDNSCKHLQSYSNEKHLPQIISLGRILFITAVLAFLKDQNFPLEQVEIFSSLYLFKKDLFSIALLISVLWGAALANRFYCRFLCPLRPVFDDIETIKKIFSSSYKERTNQQSTNCNNSIACSVNSAKDSSNNGVKNE